MMHTNIPDAGAHSFPLLLDCTINLWPDPPQIDHQ